MLYGSEVVRRTYQNIILPTPDIIHISVPSEHLMTTDPNCIQFSFQCDSVMKDIVYPLHLQKVVSDMPKTVIQISFH